MSASEDETRCVAITRAGGQCKNQATAGSEYCHIHRPVPILTPADKSSNGDTPADRPAAEDQSGEALRRQLMAELDALIMRVKALSPGYEPPEFTPRRIVEVMDEQAKNMTPAFALGMLERLRKTINRDLLDVETWKGIWYMVNYTLEYQSDILQRRFKGEYETDEWGLDWEYLEAVRPFLDFMYKVYWRVASTGIEAIPDYDRALLVSNHSGQAPWDGVMIMTAILNEHPAQRLTRNLFDESMARLPFIASSLVKIGQAVDSVENGTRLLERDELVGVYPEGLQGSSKLFKDRYKLTRFGRSGFVKMALKTRAPVIPVSVVGAEETYISLAKSPTLAKLTGLPDFPITPRFPWLGPLGAIPWPTKWYIDFGEPVSFDGYEPDAADDAAVVSQLTDRVRNIIQEMVNRRLALRRSVLG
ncbi:MAG: lysophospholipid acyltransferase family protein [Chloroflexota bacterium]|jgi:1-acyl-sn-glycerol-3-phosphate acyltransferase